MDLTDVLLGNDSVKTIHWRVPPAVRTSSQRRKKCKMATEPQTYFSDMRPRFEPFVIDCGKIAAYRYSGSLRSELKSKLSPRRKRSRSSKTCWSSANSRR